jgi:teichuronic acid biosynthesis glycosyltransferase TuaC
MTPLRVLAVTNMYPAPDAPTSGVFIEQQVEGLRRSGVDVQVLLFDRRNLGRGVYRSVGRQLAEAVRRSPVDLVHVMYGGVMADRATRCLPGLPVLVTFHGSDLQGAAPGSGALERLSAAYGVHASKRAALRASGVVVVAEHLARLLPAGLPARRVRVIPAGIDLDRFRPLDSVFCRSRLGWAPDRFHVVFATGNGDPVKRPELAREAVGRLAAAGCPAELHVLSGVTNETVPVWLNAADVLLLTSLREGSPTIVKEAMACERPVVSVDVGDVALQLRGIPGCHLAEADPGALASALESVFRGPRRARGRARAAEVSVEVTSGRLLEFYNFLLRNGDDAACRSGRPAVPEDFSESEAS